MVKRYFSNPVFLSVFILCLIFYAGIINIPASQSYSSLINDDLITQFSGTIISSPVKSSSGKYYSTKLQLDSVCSKNGVLSQGSGVIDVLIPATMVEVFFPGKLYTASKTSAGFLYEAGGYYVFKGKYFNSRFLVEDCLFNKWENSIFGKIDYFRAKCRLQFKRLMFSWKEAGGLLLALLCGAREYTEVSVSNSFKNAGLSHILALSGMHLSMFSGIALFFGNYIGRKKITFIIRIIALMIFVWFAGFSPSLFRAFICSMLIIFASIASVDQPDMILILCFSFLLQCVLSPSDIYNYGFMLSYGALFGILLTAKALFRFYTRFMPVPAALSFSSSTGAQLFTLPLSLKLFQSYSPVGIIASSVISPIITIFIYSGLILILISLIIPPLSRYSGILLNFEYTIIKYLVGLFSLAPRIQI